MWRMVVGGLALALAGAVPAAAADLIGVSFSGNVYYLDPGTGTGAKVASAGVGGINSLAGSPSGQLYCVGHDPVTSGENLLTLDPASGQASIVAPVSLGTGSSIRALSFSPDGVLYAIQNGGGPGTVGQADLLYTLNTATGAATLVGSVSFVGVQAIAFSPEGTLYGWDGGTGTDGAGLITIDPATGAATDVNPMVGGNNDTAQGMTFASDGTLFGARNDLHIIDRNTGAVSAVGAGGYTDVRGIAFVSTSPVPPSNLTATAVSRTRVNLTWSDNSTDETGFRIERRSGTAAFEPIGSVNASVTSFSDRTLSARKTYTYRVVATGAPDSLPSEEVTVTTLGGKLSAPSGLSFGPVKGAKEKVLTIKNTHSRETLEVSVTIPNSRFSIVSGAGPVVIKPRRSHSVRIRFAPGGKGSAKTELRVSSSDPSRRVARVRLTGRGK